MKSTSHRRGLKIALFGIILLCLIAYILYDPDDDYIKNARLEIKSDPNVLDVIFRPDTQLTYTLYAVDITFNDGGNIYVVNYNFQGKEIKHKPVYITILNNYIPWFYSKDKKDIARYKDDFAIWSAIIGVRLETIEDIAKNYYAISEQMEKWIDLSVYRISGETTFTTIERAIANVPDLNTVIYDGQEYALFKQPSMAAQGARHP